jgi:hypothetical protein
VSRASGVVRRPTPAAFGGVSAVAVSLGDVVDVAGGDSVGDKLRARPAAGSQSGARRAEAGSARRRGVGAVGPDLSHGASLSMSRLMRTVSPASGASTSCNPGRTRQTRAKMEGTSEIRGGFLPEIYGGTLRLSSGRPNAQVEHIVGIALRAPVPPGAWTIQGSRPDHRVDVDPASSRNTSPPMANSAVTSRLRVTLPSCRPSCV